MKKIYRNRAKSKKPKRITVQVKNTIALPERARTVASLLSRLRTVFGELFPDENFLVLLEAESLCTIPAYLNPLLEEARNGHETC
jgi:hypothetical protein